MHINSDRLIESLTEVELMHINNCTQCAMERQKLVALKISANQINVDKPPNLAWENIAKSLPVDKKKNNRIKELIYAFAASLFMVSVGWLMWSNHSLQNQLQQVLIANQVLELQLKQEANIQQPSLLLEVKAVESNLYHSNNTHHQLQLLKARQRLLQQIVERQAGEQHEFSI